MRGMLRSRLGIDLGTTNTLVFVPGRGIVLNEPSVVAISSENKIVAVGNEAKEMVGRTPETITAYRPLRDGVIADYRVTEAMLRYYIRRSIGRFSLLKPEVMISVPAGVTSTERRAVIEAALRAGASQVYVIKEPILAAIGAGVPIQEPGGNMIIDIGGGTTDVAVISMGGIVTAISAKVAGTKFDAAIAGYLKRHYGIAIGEKMAEEIKINVGSAMPVEHELSMHIKGSELSTGLPKTFEITTNIVAYALAPTLAEVVRAIREVLQETPPELAADIIDHGITMTGGSSQLRELPALITHETGVYADVANDALYCVANGTGVALDHLDIYKKSIISK